MDCAKSEINANEITHLKKDHEDIKETAKRTFKVIDDMKQDIAESKKDQAVFIAKAEQFIHKHEQRMAAIEEKHSMIDKIITVLKTHKNIQWGILITIIGLLGWLFRTT